MIIYPSQVAYLRVVVPPEIESAADGAGNHDVMTSEGSSVKLSCKARGILSHDYTTLNPLPHPNRNIKIV